MIKSFFCLVLIGSLAWLALAHAQPYGGRGSTETSYEMTALWPSR